MAPQVQGEGSSKLALVPTSAMDAYQSAVRAMDNDAVCHWAKSKNMPPELRQALQDNAVSGEFLVAFSGACRNDGEMAFKLLSTLGVVKARHQLAFFRYIMLLHGELL